jgi:hypothetical protein
VEPLWSVKKLTFIFLYLEDLIHNPSKFSTELANLKAYFIFVDERISIPGQLGFLIQRLVIYDISNEKKYFLF